MNFNFRIKYGDYFKILFFVNRILITKTNIKLLGLNNSKDKSDKSTNVFNKYITSIIRLTIITLINNSYLTTTCKKCYFFINGPNDYSRYLFFFFTMPIGS